jgi:uncharacterized protein (TIGR00251 family)
MDIAGLDVRAVEGGVAIAVKAVPGAKRDGIAGVLGTRLKVRVSAPPEDGRANAAICAVIAAALGVKPRAVTVVTGHASAEKQIRVEGVSVDDVARAIGA